MKTAGIEAPPLYMDSQAKYVVLASGQAEGFFYLLPPARPQYRMKVWDVAPGAVVIEEAGGRITDLRGDPLDFTAGVSLERNPGLLITNGHLHAYALETLEKIGQRP
jgi:3'(2'), 5'-bisphosphate nucleotidase